MYKCNSNSKRKKTSNLSGRPRKVEKSIIIEEYSTQTPQEEDEIRPKSYFWSLVYFLAENIDEYNDYLSKEKRKGLRKEEWIELGRKVWGYEEDIDKISKSLKKEKQIMFGYEKNPETEERIEAYFLSNRIIDRVRELEEKDKK